MTTPKKRKPRRPGRGLVATQNAVAALSAQGLTAREIGAATGLSPGYVHNVAQDPKVRHQIAVYRDAIREVHLRRALSTTDKAYEWLDEVTTAKDDPRAFHSLAQGLHAMEKTAASASGEDVPVDTPRDPSDTVHLLALLLS